jgi:hypothetical protein
MRRIRTRLPTYLSTGLGALVDISNSPWILAPGNQAPPNGASGAKPSNPARREGALQAREQRTDWLNSERTMRSDMASCQQFELGILQIQK